MVNYSTGALLTGSVVLSGLPATWTLVRSDGTSSITTSGTGIATTISN
jgi:hypothetical protein